jgi:hypothetical protein
MRMVIRFIRQAGAVVFGGAFRLSSQHINANRQPE